MNSTADIEPDSGNDGAPSWLLWLLARFRGLRCLMSIDLLFVIAIYGAFVGAGVARICSGPMAAG